MPHDYRGFAIQVGPPHTVSQDGKQVFVAPPGSTHFACHRWVDELLNGPTLKEVVGEFRRQSHWDDIPDFVKQPLQSVGLECEVLYIVVYKRYDKVIAYQALAPDEVGSPDVCFATACYWPDGREDNNLFWLLLDADRSSFPDYFAECGYDHTGGGFSKRRQRYAQNPSEYLRNWRGRQPRKEV